MNEKTLKLEKRNLPEGNGCILEVDLIDSREFNLESVRRLHDLHIDH